MDITMDIAIGQVVMSKAGRDKGKNFLVYDIIDAQYVLLVDGDLRTLKNPKKKKIKHLVIYNTILSELKESIQDDININDAYIRKLLEPFKKGF